MDKRKRRKKSPYIEIIVSGSTWRVGCKLVLCRSFQGFSFFHSVHKLFWVFLQGMIKTIRALSWHGRHLAHSGYRFPLVTAIECIIHWFLFRHLLYCSLLLMLGFHNHRPIHALNNCPEASLPSAADYTLFSLFHATLKDFSHKRLSHLNLPCFSSLASSCQIQSNGRKF